MKTLTVKPNKDGQKRIRIGDFIIRFDSLGGRQNLAILKADARGLPRLVAGALETPKNRKIRDWMIHIHATDDPNDKY